MTNMRDVVADAIRALGARRVASALGISREAAMSLALGVAHPGTVALAQPHLARLERLMDVSASR